MGAKGGVILDVDWFLGCEEGDGRLEPIWEYVWWKGLTEEDQLGPQHSRLTALSKDIQEYLTIA